MHRNTNRTGLVGNRARNRLANPPRGVGRKLVTAAIFELIHGLHQADVAFLNQIQELKTTVGVFLRDRNDETKIGFDELALRLVGFALADRQRVVNASKLFDRDAGFFFETVDLLQIVFFALNQLRKLLLADVVFLTKSRVGLRTLS